MPWAPEEFKAPAASYGAPAAGASSGSSGAWAAEELKPAQWHTLGDPWALLIRSVFPILKQCVTLGIIIMSVFFSHDQLMSCDPTRVGMPLATLCEYSKAYVRCFPLLALLVAIMVASRELFQHRVYYRLLQHGILLDIENFSPLSDPLFLLVLFCAANSILHYVLLVWTAADIDLLGDVSGTVSALKSEELVASAQDASVFFIGPVILFVVYLHGAYDTEAGLLPLSKYFEEDVDGAHRMLARIPVIKEPATAAAVRLDMCPAGRGVELPKELSEVFNRLLQLSQAREAAAKEDPEKVPQLSRWRLMSSMWPAQLLLQRSLDDRESRNFRKSWYCFCALALSVMLGILYFTCRGLVEKFYNTFTGQPEDFAGVMVIALHVLVNIYLIYVILGDITIPCRT